MDNPFKSFFHLAPKNVCPHCGQSYIPGTEVIVTKHIGRMIDQAHFCSEACAHDWYIKHLRKAGL